MKEIVFISGHRDITPEEFAEHYAGEIADAVLEGSSFVVGDCEGVDHMAQMMLKNAGAKNVVVFHMFTDPRYYVEGFDKSGGFKSDVDRDFAMTLISDRDLCWVRKGKERSGTAQNVWRRGLKENGITNIQEVMTLEASMFL